MSEIQAEYTRRCSVWSDIFQHLPRLHAEASTGDARVIELGVRSGNSTVAFLSAVEKAGGHVWSCDIAPPPSFRHPQWTFVLGDDLTAAEVLPNDVDVVFIDTSHHYRHTLAEIELYSAKVKPGGVLLLHDTELERPDGARPGDPAFPVRAAINHFCAVTGLEPEFVSGCYGLAAIRIPCTRA